MLKTPTEISYRVCYRAKVTCPHKRLEEGEEGVHANKVFGLAKAEASAQDCKNWFNLDKELVEPAESSKSGVDEVKVNGPFDRVVVWIDTFKDGQLHKSGDPEDQEKEACPEPSSHAQTEASDTSSTGEKSRNRSMAAVA